MPKPIDCISRIAPSINKLALLYPVHASAVNERGRLASGAVLKTFEIISAGRHKKVDVFVSSAFCHTGLSSIEVMFGKKKVELELFSMPKEEPKPDSVRPDLNTTYSGIAVSSGYASGKAMLWLSWEKGRPPVAMYSIPERDLDKEVLRFKTALASAADHYRGLVETARDPVERSIYEVHLGMLCDDSVREKIENGIRKEKINAEHITHDVMNQYIKSFEAMDDQYFRQRADDIRNISQVILEIMTGVKRRKKIEGEKVVLIAEDLLVTDIADIKKAGEKILAIVTEKGGPTSHAAIIARNLGIPAVLGVEKATTVFREGEVVTVDGRKGEVTARPSSEMVRDIEDLKRSHDIYVLKVEREVRGKPALTRDGHRIIMGANIISSQDVAAARMFEADKIGLFRTEMMISSGRLLSEDDQYDIYSGLIDLPADIRTFDIGGDKTIDKNLPPEMQLPAEANPFLGLRGIRLYSYNDFWQGIFRAQVRAVLRASAKNRGLSIMFPMVSKLEEFRWAKKVVAEEQAGLKGGYNKDIKLGVMIEVPSVISYIDQMAKEADYFSFGSNDMIQYLMAADRGNRKVAYLYDPFHYSLIWSLKRTIFAAHKQKKAITLCGNMGADPYAVLLLIGLGIDGISMDPSFIPKIKYVLQGLDRTQSEAFAKKVYDEYFDLFKDTAKKSTKKQIEELALGFFPIDLIERATLVSGKLSGLSST